ncbi:hypothetical protein GQ54DRAFT_17428 [Martensiomyces pterosporus]|nr:hypothetical protein GQ54DRAFT_17428 [Martensiomyces pterosporus]
MQRADVLLKLQDRLACPYCQQILHRPRTLSSCQHSLCRICLDQLLAGPESQCPKCQQSVSCTSDICVDQALDELVRHYYIIKPPPSPPIHRLGPLVSLPSSPEERLGESQVPMPKAAGQKTAGAEERRRSELLDDLLNDSGLSSSGSETDLDLPEPSSFLGFSSSPDVPKTLLPSDNASEDKAEEPPLNTLRRSQRSVNSAASSSTALQRPVETPPKSPGKSKIAATYSAKQARRTRGNSLSKDTVGSPGRRKRAPTKKAVAAPEAKEPAAQPSRRSSQKPQPSRLDSEDSGVAVASDDDHDGDGDDEKDTKQLKRAGKSTPAGTASKRRKSLRGKQAISRESSADDASGSKESHDEQIRLSLLTTGLTDAQTTKLKRAAKRAATQLSWAVTVHSEPGLLRNAVLSAKHAKKSGNTYTHLVTVTSKDNRTPRTFKYLAGLVSGAWVVKMEWVLESIKAHRLLPEADFAVDGDTALAGYRLDGPRAIGELFEGHSVYVWGDLDIGAAYSSTDAMNLIRATGAVAEAHHPLPPEPDGETAATPNSKGTRRQKRAQRAMDKAVSALPDNHRHLFEIPVCIGKTTILVDTSTLSGAKLGDALDEITEATGGTYPCRTKAWFFDCISANEILL